jgi:hypothetical protein
MYSADGMSFTVSNQLTGDGGLPTAQDYQRPTGRGGPADEDVVQGRPYVAPPALPAPKPWEPLPLNSDQARNNPLLIPVEYRPRVVLRYGDTPNLLIGGLLQAGQEMAQRPAVVDARFGEGHVLLFASDPIYRGETLGSYALVFNAILNFNHLDTGRVTADKDAAHP